MERFSLRLWASDTTSEVIDPDLDASHPGGQGGAGKYAKGWIPEKEPHQWINFLYGAQEESLYQGMCLGGLPTDNTVSYKLGAIRNNGSGTWLVSLKDGATAAIDWDEVATGNSKAQFDAWVNSYTGTMNGHIGRKGPTDNAHNTTVGQAGGYTKEEANAKNTTNKTNINNHIADKNNPHKVTYTQLNCLSALGGGNFIGTVSFSGILLATGIGVRETEIFTSKEGLGITTVPWLSTTSQEILTENSYQRLRIKHEPKFAIPPEDIFVPLNGSLHSPTSGAYVLEFSRSSALEYTDRSGAAATASIDEPAFEVLGLKLAAANVIRLVGNMSGDSTIYFERDGAVQVYDVPATVDDLANWFGYIGNVKNLKVWLTPLTPEQKAMLGA